MNPLFTPVALGNLNLKNRLVMAPMSRNRATAEGLATPLMAQYYAQRASAGLIISEGIQPCVVGQGYMNSPGLHSAAQVASWQQVTQAVHQKGGLIVAQLMHAGRIGHPALYQSAHQSIAPSAVAAKGQTFTPDGMKDFPAPRAMSIAEIKQSISDFAVAAKNAIDAGFDGVEIHAGNGFLPHQFLADNTNLRTDEYGGTIEGKIRYVLELTEAVVNAVGAGRVGLRISPENPFNDMVENNALVTYQALLAELPPLAYLHIMEANNRHTTKLMREAWSGTLMLNPHQRAEDGPVNADIAKPIIEEGFAEAVAFGALFLSNPDLVARIKQGGPYNDLDDTTLYGGDAKGYTDYPTLEALAEPA